MKLCPRCAEPYADDAGFCPHDGTELARSNDPFLGRTLAARYRLVRRVGGGGAAVVYLARHVMIERLSAIKILRHDLGADPIHRERFLREARAVNRINHPNVVEITDYGEDGDLVFLVMEYVEGESLLAALEGGRFEWTRAARVAAQIASALGRTHELGVIHRDLKPENVLLVARPEGQLVKLTDFGIAKILDAPALTFSEQRFGTPGYIAPEYVEGAPAGARGDIYGLGVVLYEMLTGALPFDAKFPVDLLVLPLKEDPVKPSARVAGIPPALEALVLRMIARRPEDRPRDAFAVHDALEEALARAAPPASRAAGPRASSPDDPASGPPSATIASSRSWLAVELQARPIGEHAERWQATLAGLVERIERSSRLRGEDDGVRRARELAQVARGLIASLDRARASVAEHQARVDALDARGREFRASLGRAIEALSRDRSRERAELDAIAVRRDGIRMELAVRDPAQGEPLVWEAAALQAQETRSRALAADLGFQIETLQAELGSHNEQLEREVVEAAGMLEGALSGLRRITGELVRTMAEAASAIA